MSPIRKSFVLALLLAGFCSPLLAKGVMKEFKGVKLGDTQDAVHKLLGSPTHTSEASEDFTLGGEDSMSVVYDDQKKVRSIVIYVYGKSDKIPGHEDITGDAKLQTNPDGSSLCKLTLDKEEIFISFFQSAGESPMTVVTISRR